MFNAGDVVVVVAAVGVVVVVVVVVVTVVVIVFVVVVLVVVVVVAVICELQSPLASPQALLPVINTNPADACWIGVCLVSDDYIAK